LSNRNPARPQASSSGVVPPLPSIVPSAPVAVPPASAPQSTRDPAAILGDKPATPPASAASTKPATDPLITYFVQAGAFGKAEDAEAQRGKLAMLGMTARVTEREQSGRTVFRVRLGPFEKKEDAVSAKDRLDGAGVDSALIQVQR
ncbi:MAG: SPOR domain-containing protein, partial [Rhizobacter sp.]